MFGKKKLLAEISNLKASNRLLKLKLDSSTTELFNERYKAEGYKTSCRAYEEDNAKLVSNLESLKIDLKDLQGLYNELIADILSKEESLDSL